MTEKDELAQLKARIATLEKYQRVFEALPIGISINGDDLRFIDVNPAAQRLFAMSRTEIIGRTSKELGLLREDDAEQQALRVWVAEKGSVQNVQRRIQAKSGQVYSVALLIDRVEPDYLSTFLDITEQVRLHHLVVEQGRRDALTGLYNRSALTEILGRELARADRNKTPLSVALFDLDHFKSINDRFGHLVGDEVLRQAARVIAQTIRATDVAVRWGGEELLAILPDASLAGAGIVAERVRTAIASLVIPSIGSVTISAGVVERNTGEDATALFKRADERLYAAKNSGRNKVM